MLREKNQIFYSPNNNWEFIKLDKNEDNHNPFVCFFIHEALTPEPKHIARAGGESSVSKRCCFH